MSAGLGLAIGGALQGIGQGMMMDVLERRKFALEQLRTQAKDNDDSFTKTLRAGGIDPDSEQGKKLYRQRASTMASPSPQFISDGAGGGRWVTPPASSGVGDEASSIKAPARYVDPDDGETYELVGSDRNDPNAWKKVGGPTSSASGGFRNIPSGNPLDPRDHR